MLLRRITKHVRNQNWFAVFLDFVIVVVGVFIGIQVANWNEERANRYREEQILENIVSELRTDIQAYQSIIDSDFNKIATIEYILKNIEIDSGRNLTEGIELSGYKYDDIVTSHVQDGGKSFEERAEETSDDIWQKAVLVNNAMPSTTTFDSLVNTGELGIIENEALITDLHAYRQLTIALLEAQEVTFRPQRDHAIEIGLRFGFSPFRGVDKETFLKTVSENPILLSSIQTQLGWAKGHLTMVAGSDAIAQGLVKKIDKYLVDRFKGD